MPPRWNRDSAVSPRLNKSSAVSPPHRAAARGRMILLLGLTQMHRKLSTKLCHGRIPCIRQKIGEELCRGKQLLYTVPCCEGLLNEARLGRDLR